MSAFDAVNYGPAGEPEGAEMARKAVDAMNLQEAAKFLRLDKRTLRKLMREGEVPYAPVGTRNYRFSRQALMAWMARNPGRPAA